MANRALILGASGKVGRHSRRAFEAAGWDVRPYNRGKDNMIEAAHGCDVIVNGLNPKIITTGAKSFLRSPGKSLLPRGKHGPPSFCQGMGITLEIIRAYGRKRQSPTPSAEKVEYALRWSANMPPAGCKPLSCALVTSSIRMGRTV